MSGRWSGRKKRSAGVGLWLAVLLAAACGGESADEAGRPLGAEGAHEHAVARVDIALETDGGTIEFSAPAMGIYGFEHTPGTDAERQRQAEGERMLRTRIAEMLVFEPALGCSMEAVALEEIDTHHDHGHADGADHGHTHGSAGHDHDQPGYVPDPAHHDTTAGGHTHSDDGGPHRDVHAEFRLACERSPVGSRLRVEVGQLFPAFEDVDLRVLTPERQIGRRVSATGATVTL